MGIKLATLNSKHTVALLVLALLLCILAQPVEAKQNLTTQGQSLLDMVPKRDTSLGSYQACAAKYACGLKTWLTADQRKTADPIPNAYPIGTNGCPGTMSNQQIEVQIPSQPTLLQIPTEPPAVAKKQPPTQSHWYYNKWPNPDAPFPIDPYHEQMPYFGKCGKAMRTPAHANSAFVDYMPVLDDDPAKQTYVTNAGAQAIMMAAACKQAAIDSAPEVRLQAMMANQQGQMRRTSEAAADSAEALEATAIDQTMQSLINVANENAASPSTSQQATKTLPQAIWMVQQMFHQCYIPMAVLLLLPGAVLTQLKSLVHYGLGGKSIEEESTQITPFAGILRSIIAIFLIPATQLIMSWMIDIGNSMTYEVKNYLDATSVITWMQAQTYNPPVDNDENNLAAKPDQEQPVNPASNDSEPNKGTGIHSENAGKAQNGPEAHSPMRNQQVMTQTLQAGYNLAAMTLAAAFDILLAFQVVMMSYLFLLGPIAAAFYAWPDGMGSLFKKVFINWVDAVINLSLWRFWWIVVVLIMSIRIQYVQSLGQYDPNNHWELAMYTAFMVIICYVPFMPFEFRPGEMVNKCLEKAEQATKGGGGGNGTPSNNGSPNQNTTPLAPGQPGDQSGSGRSSTPGGSSSATPGTPPPPPASPSSPSSSGSSPPPSSGSTAPTSSTLKSPMSKHDSSHKDSGVAKSPGSGSTQGFVPAPPMSNSASTTV